VLSCLEKLETCRNYLRQGKISKIKNMTCPKNPSPTYKYILHIPIYTYIFTYLFIVIHFTINYENFAHDSLLVEYIVKVQGVF
jgi:hypothetical protein